ncbi:uncharacterized protein SOCEGT47_080510 [Sorangium cellulosum]|uniref:Apea-like HEPN domain-containing protein n=2 Tax=Sorangium cellulosum TaxID=56 RepID=A0A4P2QCJ4_SORCE|nr:uncharacterized protein SOCEGT47_080510 [Sorangium cellulosum]
MLPDVAAEAEKTLQRDVLLVSRYSARRDVLVEAARRIKSDKADDIRAALGQINALLPALRRSYIEDGFAELQRLLEYEPGEHERIVGLAECIVSELRARGWTDAGLLEAYEITPADDAVAVVATLATRVCSAKQQFECYVCLTLPAERPPFPDGDLSFRIVDALPNEPRVGRPLKRGTYAKVLIDAFDPVGAAAIAYRRVLSTVGALTVFLPESRIDVASEIVGVRLPGGSLRGCEFQERLAEEPRFVDPDGIRRILASSWAASSKPAADPLHDAIRLRHRAVYKSDPETRLLLLWSGIERMTSGARGFRGGALAAAKELVSHAVTLGKLRRDVGDFAAVMEHSVTDERARGELLRVVGGYRDLRAATDRVHRGKVLEHLLGDEAKLQQMTGPFYAAHPLLAFRAHSLWMDFGGGIVARRGKAIAEYHERSRQRVAWQVGRVYRARNRIAHVGVGPERLKDLVAHAYFYLTQLIAICVHYNETEPIRAQDLLTTRMGQYQAYVELLRKGDPAFLKPEALMRPASALQRQ